VRDFEVWLGRDFLLSLAFSWDIFKSFLVLVGLSFGLILFLVQREVPGKVPMSMEFSTPEGNVLIIKP